MLNSHPHPAGGAERRMSPRSIVRAIKVDVWLLAGSVMTAATCAHLAGSGLPADAPHRTLAAGAAVFAGRAGWSSVRALWRYFGPEEIYFGVRFRHPRR